MITLRFVDLPSAVPLGVYTGAYGTQAVLDELNTTWKNSGAGVIFGQDPFGDKFRAFSSLITQEMNEIQNVALKAIEAVTAPNKIQEISCVEDLHTVPVCMYLPILTMPEVRPLFESGQINGWGLHSYDLPSDDVTGRLLKNGRFDTSDPDYTPDAPVEWKFRTGDPILDLEELAKIRTTRDFICKFLEEQLGPEGDMLDFSDYPNRMGKSDDQ